jgi:peptidoglycan hydrolase FlgJ
MLVGSERLAIDVADAQALKGRAASGDPEALRSAARQFESMLVAQMFKTMRETRFNEEDDPMTGGEGVKLYREMLDQQWASRLSAGKGLGFAEMMVKAMESRGMAVVPDAAPQVAGMPDIRQPPLAAAVNPALSSVQSPVQSPAVTASAAGSANIAISANTGSISRKQEFLETMKPHAEAAAAATGVPARFILAHAALESGWGQREIRGANGEASHNLFGIKAGASWEGASVQTLTTEYRQGMPMKLQQNFRAYDDYSAGFTDYANLLKSRYGAALASGDSRGDVFAKGLAAGGYATDPAYAGKLKSVIASVAMAGG